MPGAADDGDALKTLFLRGTDALAHVGFALRLQRVFRLLPVAQRAHSFQNGFKEVGGVLALLHLPIPPQFGVAIPGGLRQQANGVAAQIILPQAARAIRANPAAQATRANPVAARANRANPAAAQATRVNRANPAAAQATRVNRANPAAAQATRKGWPY